MNHLLRDVAPLGGEAWAQIDREAADRLRPLLAARRLVDFAGPHGWQHSAVELGRVGEADGGLVDGVQVRTRVVLPMIELRVDFSLDRHQLADADRGDPAIDLAPVASAARSIALGENVAVLHGYRPAGIGGIAAGSSQQKVSCPGGVDGLADAVAAAVARLADAGIGGPYSLALGEEPWVRVSERIEAGGYPLLEHLERIAGGPVVRAPGLSGGLVVSRRGGDFVLDCGQDLSVGYSHHGRSEVHLYIEESIAFRVLEADAAVVVELPA